MVEDVRGGGGGFSPMCAGEVTTGGEKGSGDLECGLDTSFSVKGMIGVRGREGLLHVVMSEEGFEVVAGVAGTLVGVDAVNWAGRGVLGRGDGPMATPWFGQLFALV